MINTVISFSADQDVLISGILLVFTLFSDTAPRPYMTVTLMLVTVGIYLWVLADYDKAYDILAADYTILYQEPWRVIASPFLHYIAPHFFFNFFTLWWFGRKVEQRFKRWLFAGIFFGALLTGHVVQMLMHGYYVVGISGGVCGLYGYLLRVDRKPTLWATLIQQPSYWIYAVSLLLLLLVDYLGLSPIASWNHLFGIIFGYLIGLACTSEHHQKWWRSLSFLLPVLACIPLVYRPWELSWQVLHDAYDPSLVLPQFSCQETRKPLVDVSKNHFVTLILYDRSERKKFFYYFDLSGQKVVDIKTSRRLSMMRPYLGSIWRVEDEKGNCLTQFEVSRKGVVVLE